MNKDHLFTKNILSSKVTAKPVNLKYLYEVAAIPKSEREDYLHKISRRFNSSGQKNVRLLKIIYWHLESDRKILWDDERICNALYIRRNTLYAHKSRLLKGLREYYFGWKEIEKKEFSDKDQNDLKVKFAKAEKMYELGMKKEAKNIFLKISCRLNRKKKKSYEEKLILFNILKHLCSYYSSSINLKGFSKSYDEIENLGNTLFKKDKKLYSYIMMELYYCRAYKTMFHGDKTTAVMNSIELLKSALEEATSLKDNNKIASILWSLSSLYNTLNKQNDSEKYTKKGLKISHKKNTNMQYLAYKIHLNLLHFKKDKIDLSEIKNEIIFNYNYIKNTLHISIWSQRALFSLLSLTSLIKEKDLLHIMLYEYTSREIIFNGLDRTLRALYFMKFDNYLDKICIPELQIDTIQNREYIIIKKINPLYHGKLDSAILELTMNNNKVRDILFRKEFFIFMLYADFWKGNKCSYEYSLHIMKQIDHINKTRPEIKNNNKEEIDYAFFGITLMSESKILDKKVFLKKYEIKFKDAADAILESNNENDLTDYYMLSFIAEQCGYKELKEIVKKTYWKLEKKYPELIEKEIKRIESDEKVEDRENELMGVRAA